jgi:hypothetical protein
MPPRDALFFSTSHGAVQLLGGLIVYPGEWEMESQELARLEEMRERVSALGGYL